MYKYEIEFHGRLKFAIGINYKIIDTVHALNENDAILKLYEKYDSVLHPKIRLIN